MGETREPVKFEANSTRQIMVETVQTVGEQGLLQRIQAFCPAGVVGDDAALLTVAPGRSLVVTEDLLVDGVHFSLGLARPDCITTSPMDAGWRAAAANLSDLAAMGAAPLGITVGLALPATLPVDWVEELYRGITGCLKRFGTEIVGGDLCRSPVLTVAIAAFGEVLPTRALRRSAARPGDAILVTGVHGASRAGLELLLYPEQGQGLDQGDRHALIQAHQRPQPRLDVVAQIEAIVAAQGRMLPERAIAGMDSSDGLADAVLQICRASGVGAQLERSQIPMPAVFAEWLPPQQAMEWALYGGEDFELVLCLPLLWAEALRAELPTAAIVGCITEAHEVVLADASGKVAAERLGLERGFQHFAPPHNLRSPER